MFILEYIEQTKIGEIRAAILERESQKTLKQKQRDKSRPKSNRMHVDFQTLHDAFFKYATIPELSKFGDLHYEGKEREEKTRQFKPGQLSMKLKEALSIVLVTTPPPWLITMQRYGPPSSYPNLKIPGLNAPLPAGAQWGFHGGGWGKPPSDQFGNPLYPEVFSDPIATTTMPSAEELATIQYWGDIIDTIQDDSDQDELEDEDGETIIPFIALSEINLDDNAGEIPAPPRGPPPSGVAAPHYAPPGGSGIKPPLSAIPPLPTALAPITAKPIIVPNIVAPPYLPVAMPQFGGLVTPTTLIAAHSPGYGLASSLSTPSLEFSPQSIKQQLKEQEAASWRASEATQQNEGESAAYQHNLVPQIGNAKKKNSQPRRRKKRSNSERQCIQREIPLVHILPRRSLIVGFPSNPEAALSCMNRASNSRLRYSNISFRTRKASTTESALASRVVEPLNCIEFSYSLPNKVTPSVLLSSIIVAAAPIFLSSLLVSTKSPRLSKFVILCRFEDVRLCGFRSSIDVVKDSISFIKDSIVSALCFSSRSF